MLVGTHVCEYLAREMERRGQRGGGEGQHIRAAFNFVPLRVSRY